MAGDDDAEHIEVTGGKPAGRYDRLVRASQTLVRLAAGSVRHLVVLARSTTAPSLASLRVQNATLTRALELVRPPGKGAGGPYVIVSVDDETYRIDNVCVPFAWHCALSPALAKLHAGDRVRTWAMGNRCWQLAREGEALPDVSYAETAQGYNRGRVGYVIGALILVGVFLIRLHGSRARSN